MKTLWVNSEKFKDIDKLNRQVRLAMIRHYKTTGVFEIGDRYLIDGMIKLILK